jgi:hypothetical protein
MADGGSQWQHGIKQVAMGAFSANINIYLQQHQHHLLSCLCMELLLQEHMSFLSYIYLSSQRAFYLPPPQLSKLYTTIKYIYVCYKNQFYLDLVKEVKDSPPIDYHDRDVSVCYV